MRRFLGVFLALLLAGPGFAGPMTTLGAGKPTSGAPPFTLASIQSQLPFWYDVSDASTVTSGGNIIVSLNNLGTVTSATMTSTGSQAGTYSATGLGGQPAVTFQTSWPWLQTAGNVTVASATERHIFVVAKLTANSENEVFFAVGSTPAFATSGFGLALWNLTNGCCIPSAGDLFMFANNTFNSTPQFAAASGVATDFTNLHLFEAHLGTSGVSGHIDGTDLGAGSAGSGTGTVPATSAYPAWIGVNPSTDYNNFVFGIVVVYDGNTDVANIRNLLKTRYSIP